MRTNFLSRSFFLSDGLSLFFFFLSFVLKVLWQKMLQKLSKTRLHIIRTHTHTTHIHETPRRELKRFNEDEQQRYDSSTTSSGGRFVVVVEKLLFSLPRW